ncbi:Endopolyphosphatase [Apophysomyces ossiformis]|uniref:Endopolyphosphatase n=1 Tax=Apophysomyces ossiformis TaxID=679940 RepID=A0A8H7BWZ3_9FUNG|nr:Endopolyphosphatase [Apophysomyces ossiformis]
MHMDSYFQVNATIKSECHRAPKKHKGKKWRKGKLAGYWGSPTSECDAPTHLIEHTINWIGQNWKNKLDFVIWTGDNARHDIDGKIPRTRKEILDYNQRLTDMMRQTFTMEETNRTITIVPVIGNNDIHPHNILHGNQLNRDKPITLEDFATMWRDFIPQDQLDAFMQGGYFAIDVVPGIRVLSLNTLYFFNSNDAVHPCKVKGGTADRHMEWIKEQLERARKDRVKVYMIGHVPPSPKTFRKSCLSRYINISLAYADIITGHMYGHANMDHFQILKSTKKSKKKITEPEGDLRAEKDVDRFISSLRQQYKQAHSENGTSAIVVHVAPPVLPVYHSTFRINQYDKRQASFGQWLQYTQWYANLTYWNQLPQNRPLEYEIEYATDTTYDMADLGVDSWLELARRMTENTKVSEALWNTYLDNMLVQTYKERRSIKHR